MGQGFSLTTLSAGSAGIDVPELADLVYEKSMGTARFMKSIRARNQDGIVLVKVVVKPYAMDLKKYRHKIIRKAKTKHGREILLTSVIRGAQSFGGYTECSSISEDTGNGDEWLPGSSISV